jgi:hypothetical protein
MKGIRTPAGKMHAVGTATSGYCAVKIPAEDRRFRAIFSEKREGFASGLDGLCLAICFRALPRRSREAL